MTLGKKIFELRTAKKWSLRALGNISQTSFAQLNKVENEYDPRTGGAPTMTIDSLARVCAALEYDLPLFLEETGYIPPRPADEVELVEIYRSLEEDKKTTLLDAARTLR
jgi:transcriptional regulator with XRE-family HTH domain